MKSAKITIMVLTLFLAVWIKAVVMQEPKVETFKVHVIEKGETPQSIMNQYNGGGVDKKYADELMLLNPSQEFKVGEKIQVPVFKH